MKIDQTSFFSFFKPSKTVESPVQTASPAVHQDSVTLGGTTAPTQAPSEKAPVESPPAGKSASPNLTDLPFQSVDNAPPKSQPNLHTKTLLMEDFHQSNFPSKAEKDFPTTAFKPGMWMEDPGSLDIHSAKNSKTFQETLAQITKDFESVNATKGASGGAAGMAGAMGSMMGLGLGSAVGGFAAVGGVAPASAPPLAMPTAPVQQAEAVKGPQTITPAQRAAEVKQAVNANLSKMGAMAHFKVDQHLFPLLDKVGLDASEFFTARACWQGVYSKRRAVLEKVLDQFPKLPKDQKNVEAATAAAQAGGTQITESDRYFLSYFFENRKEMKTLFRASLNRFEGDQISVYRGQSDEPRFTKDSTKPLGCYSFDPSVSESWGDNLKRYRVKLSDVWSTSVVTQNSHHAERELTVYSRGGVRKGEKVTNTPAEIQDFKKSYSPNDLMNAAEGKFAATKASPNPAPTTKAAHLAPAYGSD